MRNNFISVSKVGTGRACTWWSRCIWQLPAWYGRSAPPHFYYIHHLSRSPSSALRDTRRAEALSTLWDSTLWPHTTLAYPSHLGPEGGLSGDSRCLSSRLLQHFVAAQRRGGRAWSLSFPLSQLFLSALNSLCHLLFVRAWSALSLRTYERIRIYADSHDLQ